MSKNTSDLPPRMPLTVDETISSLARSWPPKAQVVFANHIGAKCIVRVIPDGASQWTEAGGLIRSEVESEDAPRGVGVDTRQSRIYFRHDEVTGKPICRVILPNDFNFRNSRKGKVDGRSKSFDKDGNPVPEVLLLYALKTGFYEDRLRAIEAFPCEIWGAETFGEMFSAMDDVSMSEQNFRIFAGERLVRSALEPNKLSDWVSWENVAKQAADLNRENLSREKMIEDPLNKSLFLKAVRETATEHQGLPAQKHVEIRWLKLGGIGEWRTIRETLGFDWLPSLRDWEEHWKKSL